MLERHYVIFEGADRSGKTTSKLMFNEISKYHHYVVDRLFYSNYLYDMIIRDVVKTRSRFSIFKESDHFKEVVRLNSSLIFRGKKPILFVLLVRDSIISKYKRDQEIFVSHFKDFANQTGSRSAVIVNNGSINLLKSKIRKLEADVRWNFM